MANRRQANRYSLSCVEGTHDPWFLKGREIENGTIRPCVWGFGVSKRFYHATYPSRTRDDPGSIPWLAFHFPSYNHVIHAVIQERDIPRRLQEMFANSRLGVFDGIIRSLYLAGSGATAESLISPSRTTTTKPSRLARIIVEVSETHRTSFFPTGHFQSVVARWRAKTWPTSKPLQSLLQVPLKHTETLIP